MEKTIRQLSGELKARGNLEQNLPVLMYRTASAYGELSLYNLAMELSMFLESKAEGRIKTDETVKELEEIFFTAMKEALLDGYEPEKNKKAVEALISLRENISERMEVLTAYTDLFILYEYILNRLEPKFEPQTEDAEEMDNDAVAREILQWIFSDEEHALINERIKEMLSCLPVRMTKGKINELIENAFTLYKDADRQSIDMFDYMLRSASGLYRPKGMETQFPKLEEIRKALEEMTVSEPTKEAYAEFKQQFEQGSNMVRNFSEYYGALQTLANELLTVLLTRPYFTLEAERSSAEALTIVRKLSEEQENDSESLFAGIENKMEGLSEQVTLLEPLLSMVTEEMGREISELMLTTVHQGLLAAQRLNSGSTFATLMPKEEQELPEGYLNQVKKQFTEEVHETLTHGSRMRNRAVMAAILRELPVYFSSHTEVMNYVRSSLDSCHDEGEKRIGVELLRSYYA
ncbi:MAG: hypothetical protein ACI4FZ_09270 [Lachnospiraceae bacterium]